MMVVDDIRPTWLEVDLDRLGFNMRSVRNYVDEGVRVLAIVKANAYGHGAVESSRVFLENGADMLGVATLVEAIELRRAGIGADILILGYTQDTELHKVVENNVIQMVYSLEQAEILAKEAKKSGRPARVHIKLDTGMSRLGFPISEESLDIIEVIYNMEGIMVEGMYSHFLQSDIEDKTITSKQYKKFMWVSDGLEARGIRISLRHISNSASVLDTPEYNLDMVRVGQMIYGIYSSDEVKKSNIDIKFASSFKTRIADFRTISKGDFVGYDQGFIAGTSMKIATIPVGYVDGYNMEMNGIVQPHYRGIETKIIGNICMDQTMINISNLEKVSRGDILTLYGYEDRAMRAQLIGRIGRRVPRVYISGGEVVSIVDYLEY